MHDLVVGLAEDVPALPHARYRLVSATLTASPRHPVGAFLGDLLVRPPSAYGRNRGRADLFPGAEVLHCRGRTTSTCSTTRRGHDAPAPLAGLRPARGVARARSLNPLLANRGGHPVDVSVLRASVAFVNNELQRTPIHGARGQRRRPATYGLDDHIYQRLLRERIVFLGSEVRDQNANAICAQLLLLSAEDPEADIFLHINSPGGSVDAGMAIYDTMNYIPNDVATVGMGLAASMGQFLLCAGTKGKRYALPHARIMMHQPSSGMGGSASDIKIQAQQSLHIKKVLLELIAEHTGQPVEQVSRRRPRPLVHRRAGHEYGLVDQVVKSAREAADEGRPAHEPRHPSKD